jgi:hypothetical protein
MFACCSEDSCFPPPIYFGDLPLDSYKPTGMLVEQRPRRHITAVLLYVRSAIIGEHTQCPSLQRISLLLVTVRAEGQNHKTARHLGNMQST